MYTSTYKQSLKFVKSENNTNLSEKLIDFQRLGKKLRISTNKNKKK